MAKLKQRLDSCERALMTLEEILEEEFSVIVRDAAIQRFEYTFESLWKLLKRYLQEGEGIICNSPKRCWREALAVHLANEEEVKQLLAMTDDRNLTSHTYVEAIAESIYRKLPRYWQLMQAIHGRIAARIAQIESEN